MPVLTHDPGHGVRLPTGVELARLLRHFFRLQLTELRRNLRSGLWTPHSLQQWTMPMMEAIIESGIFQRWIALGMRREARQTIQRSMRKSVGIGFDVFNARIVDFARQMAFNFCQETNDTASEDISEAYEHLRQALAEGAEEGMAQREFTERVQEIFTDPMRAHRIAATEGSRATHGGQALQQRESGVVTAKRWLAHPGACPKCAALDGKEVPLDEPFVILPSGNPAYRVIMYPPFHPWCACAEQSVV